MIRLWVVDYTKSLFLLVQSEMKSVLQGLDMATLSCLYGWNNLHSNMFKMYVHTMDTEIQTSLPS